MSSASQGLPALDRIEEEWLDPALIESVPVDWVRRNVLVPFRRNGQVAIAGAEASPIQAYEDLSLLLGVEAAWVVAPAAEIQRAIDRCYYRRAGQAGAAAAQAATDEGGEAPLRREADDLLAGSADAPVAHYVNLVLLEAVKRGASDIHIEPFANALAVRYRIDGLLYEQPSPPRPLESALTARLKVMAKLDLAEKRLPQDGVARVRVGAREIDVRVSSVPVAEGERIVLRLLHRESTRFTLNELGMSPAMLEQFRGILREPHGIVLVTGPTGSGKTTTLYAALSEIRSPEDKIVTIEDPVEYQLKGITQIPINEKKGLTFARGLRSILRHDPDKIMVGEIRDPETAQIAIQSALTGHLVFTTVHANNVVDVLGRFLNMGVEPYQFVSALNCVLAQRLVRVICVHCRRPSPPGRALLEESGIDPAKVAHQTFYEGAGCIECGGTGYKGRTAVCELLDLSDAIRELILARKPTSEIKKAAREEGMRFLRESAVERVMQGITTLREINKVTFVE